MGSEHTTNATARTTITLMEGIDMNKLLDELVKEYEDSRPPEDAVSVGQLAEKLDTSKTYARAILERKEKNEGWISALFRGGKYYWKP